MLEQYNIDGKLDSLIINGRFTVDASIRNAFLESV